MDIKIDFNPARTPEPFDIEERMKFWESCRPWLDTKGYNLYRINSQTGEYDCGMSPNVADSVGVGHELPYSFHENPDQRDKLQAASEGRAVFAQDSHGRHIVLKLVPNDSDEMRVYQLILQTQRSGNYPGGHISGIVPVLDLVEFGGHWLAVMPRWETTITLPWFNTIDDAFLFIRCLLHGLVFLHSHRVIHRDLELRNCLVNHFLEWSCYHSTPMRRDLMEQGKLVYVIMDFDAARILPASTTRLSYKQTWWGTPFPATDVAQGEYDYDPFAYDVAILGKMLCSECQHLSKIAPGLVPFFDGMVTRDVAARFTAAEALSFIEDRYAEMSEAERCAVAPSLDPTSMPRRYFLSYEEFDRWEELPREFVEKWGHLRVGKVPRSVKLLRAICRYRWSASVVRSFRRMGDKLAKTLAC